MIGPRCGNCSQVVDVRSLSPQVGFRPCPHCGTSVMPIVNRTYQALPIVVTLWLILGTAGALTAALLVPLPPELESMKWVVRSVVWFVILSTVVAIPATLVRNYMFSTSIFLVTENDSRISITDTPQPGAIRIDS